MLIYFDSPELEQLYLTPLIQIRGEQQYPAGIIKQFKRKVQLLIAIKELGHLVQFKGLRFEYLNGNRYGYCSIRLNDQYRLLFRPKFTNSIEIILITEISKHYQ